MGDRIVPTDGDLPPVDEPPDAGHEDSLPEQDVPS